jgi:hypothetical protein
VRLDRLYPGGPSKGMFVARFGPDGRTLGSFELTAKNSDDLPRMMNEGVQRMDDLFTQALAAGIVRGDPDLIIQAPPPPKEEDEVAPVEAVVAPTVVQVLVIERGDANAVAQSVAQIRGLTGVIWVTQAALPNGNANLSVNFRGEINALGSALFRAAGRSPTAAASSMSPGGQRRGRILRHEVAGGPDRVAARLAASPG